MIKENRRKKARRKKILIALLIFTALVAILAYIGIEGFTLKQVEVKGNELYTDDQIKDSVLNDDYSWNTLYVALKYRFFHTEEIPFIDEMEVELLSPHEVRINVYEKAIIGYLPANDQNVYFDKDGFVVEISKRLIEDVPKVEGIECEKVIVYEKLKLDDNEALPFLLTFSQQLQKYGLVPGSIVFHGHNDLSAVFGGLTVDIGGSENLVEKVMRLDAIMPEITGKKGTLHLEDWTPLVSDVVFVPEK